jgi:hypothetical protein
LISNRTLIFAESLMKIQLPPFREKRQFGRVNISQPTLCQVYVPQSRKLRGYRGIIQNISLGGIYFVCDEKPPLEKGDIQHLIVNVIYNSHKIYRLIFHGLIVRTENRGSENRGSQFAAALKFLSNPIYYPLKNIKDKDLPFLDKTRIMYQFYELNKKAYEIIKQTPDIRTERINDIKRRIDQDLYKIEHNKLAQYITDNLNDRFNKIAEEFYRRILK